MPVLGLMPRYFREKEMNWDDEYVRLCLSQNGIDSTPLNSYVVVPKRQKLADNAISRYNRDPSDLSVDVLSQYDLAMAWYEKIMAPFITDTGVCDFDEVFSWLDLSTSPGYPWTQVCSTKREFLQRPHFVDFYHTYFERLGTSDPIISLASSSLKHELRLREKVEDDSARTIFSVDVCLVGASHSLCLDYNRRVVANVEKHPFCLGLNIFQGGFHRLNQRLSQFEPESGPSTLELDGNKFDSRLLWCIFKKIYQHRWRMLSPKFRTVENLRRLLNIAWQIVHSPVVNVDGWVYERFIGNCSGQGNTTFDNNIKNFLDLCVMFLRLVPGFFHSVEAFSSLLIFAICGDDLNVSVSGLIQGWFNWATIARVSKDIRMVYTTPVEFFRHNRDTQFLGHGWVNTFVPHLGSNMYFPTIDCTKMRSSLLHGNEHDTIDFTIIRACALRVETFACTSCRAFFSIVINWLRRETRDDQRQCVVDAWKSYKTDGELFRFFSGPALA